MNPENKTTDGRIGHDFWDELPENVRIAINQAKAELDRGEGIRHDEVMADLKKTFLSE